MDFLSPQFSHVFLQVRSKFFALFTLYLALSRDERKRKKKNLYFGVIPIFQREVFQRQPEFREKKNYKKLLYLGLAKGLKYYCTRMGNVLKKAFEE